MPTNNATFAAGTPIPMSISTSDPDGYAASVEVWQWRPLATGNAVNTTATALFSLRGAVYPGVMTLTAAATDNWKTIHLGAGRG